jgi:hypothetical protein
LRQPIANASCYFVCTSSHKLLSTQQVSSIGEASLAGFDDGASIIVHHRDYALALLTVGEARRRGQVFLEQKRTLRCQIVNTSLSAIEQHVFEATLSYCKRTTSILQVLRHELGDDDPCLSRLWSDGSQPLAMPCPLLEPVEVQVNARRRAQTDRPGVFQIGASAVSHVADPRTATLIPIAFGSALPSAYVDASVNLDFSYPVASPMTVVISGPLPAAGAVPSISTAYQVELEGATGARLLADLPDAPTGHYSCAVTVGGQGTYEIGPFELADSRQIHLRGPSSFRRVTVETPPHLLTAAGLCSIRTTSGRPVASAEVSPPSPRAVFLLPEASSFLVDVISQSNPEGIRMIPFSTSQDDLVLLLDEWGPLHAVQLKVDTASLPTCNRPVWCSIVDLASGARWTTSASMNGDFGRRLLAAGRYEFCAHAPGYDGVPRVVHVPTDGPIAVW